MDVRCRMQWMWNCRGGSAAHRRLHLGDAVALPEALVGLAIMSVCMECVVPPCRVYCSAAIRIACSGDADPA
jgi:hypothetical protein